MVTTWACWLHFWVLLVYWVFCLLSVNTFRSNLIFDNTALSVRHFRQWDMCLLQPWVDSWTVTLVHNPISGHFTSQINPLKKQTKKKKRKGKEYYSTSHPMLWNDSFQKCNVLVCFVKSYKQRQADWTWLFHSQRREMSKPLSPRFKSPSPPTLSRTHPNYYKAFSKQTKK